MASSVEDISAPCGTTIVRLLLAAGCAGAVVGALAAIANIGAWAWAAELGRIDGACYWCARAPTWSLLLSILGLGAGAAALSLKGFSTPRRAIPAVGSAALAIAVLSGGVAWSFGRDALLGGWRDLVTSDMLEVSTVNGAFAMAYQAMVDGEAPTEACRGAREAVNNATGPNGIQTMLAAHLIMTQLVSEAAREERGQAVCVDRQEAESQLAQLERVWRRDVQVARWSVRGWASPSNPFGAEAFAYGVVTANYNATHGDLGVARNAGMDPSALLALETELDRRFIKLQAARDRYMALGTPQDDIGRPGSTTQPH